jgi:hypothetical protein
VQRDTDPPGPLSEWIGEWAGYVWSKRPRPPKPEKKEERPQHNPIENLKKKKPGT